MPKKREPKLNLEQYSMVWHERRKKGMKMDHRRTREWFVSRYGEDAWDVFMIMCGANATAEVMFKDFANRVRSRK